jgi:hypothetical protein
MGASMIHDLLLAVFAGTGLGIGIIVLVTIIDFGGTDEHWMIRCRQERTKSDKCTNKGTVGCTRRA